MMEIESIIWIDRIKYEELRDKVKVESLKDNSECVQIMGVEEIRMLRIALYSTTKMERSSSGRCASDRLED